MKYESTISVKGDNELISKVFASEDRKIKDKAVYQARKSKDKITFTVEAEDSTGLRTALNSITKILTVIEKTRKIE